MKNKPKDEANDFYFEGSKNEVSENEIVVSKNDS